MNSLPDCDTFVRYDVPLALLTTFRLGGPADVLAQPPDSSALSVVLKAAADSGLPVHMLGGGANLLVADDGVRGLVVRLPRPGFAGIQREANRVTVGAAHSLPSLVRFSIRAGLGGLEALEGIPGTVGAALRMNAGGKYGEIGNVVRYVRGFTVAGEPFEVSASQCGFQYRASRLGAYVITECELELIDADALLLRDRAHAIHDEKARTQPLRARSAGCVFKNPLLPGLSSAGKILDDLGLKGLRIGGAAVSPLHANFLVCVGETRAADMACLIRTLRQRVFETHGVLLELEIEPWGFAPQELGEVA